MVRLFACIALILFTLLDWGSAVAQEAKEVKAVVQEVDADAGTITVLAVSGKGKSSQIKTFNLAKPDLPVTDAGGKPTTLKGLQPDQRVFLTIGAGDEVTAIRLPPPSIYGTLLRSEPAKRFLVLKTAMEERTITVAADAKFYSASGPDSWDGLKVGQNVQVAFAPEKTEAVEVRFGKNIKPFVRLNKSLGTLIDIDANKRTIDILGVGSTQGDHSPLRHYKLTVDSTCNLLYHGKLIGPIPIDEVVRGVKLGYWKEPDTKMVAHLQIDMPTLAQRRVKAIDVVQRRLVIEDLNGDRTLSLAPNVKLMGPAGLSKIEEIRPGNLVHCGLRPDRKTIEVLQVLSK